MPQVGFVPIVSAKTARSDNTGRELSSLEARPSRSGNGHMIEWFGTLEWRM